MRLPILSAVILVMSCCGDIAAPPTPVAAAMEMTPPSLVTVEGTSIRLAAVVRAADGKPIVAPLAWSTSDVSVATVESDGTVRTLKPGGATITARATGNAAVFATCTVTVLKVPVVDVRIASPPLPFYLGRPTQLNVSVLGADGSVLTNRTVAWSSSDPRIAEISSTGTLLGKEPGTVQIIARVDDHVATITLDIRPGEDFVFVKYVDGLAKIFSLNVDGSGLSDLAPDPAYNYSPSWSPDGTRVAAFATTNGASVLRILTLGSPVIQSFPQTNTDLVMGPTWSPSGNEIALISGSLLSTVIKVINVATGAMRTVSTVTNTLYPQWSPNGQLISYTAGGRLFVNNRNGTAETVVASGVSTWSQCWGDDAHLYYWVSSYPGDLYVATVGGSAVVSTKLNTGIADSSPATVTCSKHGQVAIALNADGNSHNPTYVVSTDGKSVRLLPLPADAFVNTSWSGDGTRLYLTTYGSPTTPNSLRRLDADGSLTTLLTNAPFTGIVWNPIR